MTGPSPGAFQITTLRPALISARAWLNRAAAIGTLPTLKAALRRIIDRLTNDPVSWGNQQFRYPHLGMTIYNAVEWGIVVTYGVDAVHRLVCIKKLQLMPNHPLNAAPGGGPTP